jgi:hypothetical protein
MVKVKENLRDKLILVGVFVQGEAVSRCVVGSYPQGSGRVGGRLRGSITYATENERSGVRPEGQPAASSGDGLQNNAPELSVRIGSNVEYAPYVELGIGGNAPNAMFLRGAVEENLDRIKQLLNLEASS